MRPDTNTRLLTRASAPSGLTPAAGGSGESARLVTVYGRVSTERQDLTRQVAQRERAQVSYPEAELLCIEDVGSAYATSVFDRPGGRKLCELIEAGRVEAVFTDAQDRLSRGEDLEWVRFRCLCEAQGTRVFIDGEELQHDLGGKVTSYLKALLARQESIEKSHRMRSGKAQRAAAGLWHGGQPPYGYRAGLALDPIEAVVVQRIYLEYATGASQQDIVIGLDRDGVPPRGKVWHQGTISNILKNPVFVGWFKDGTEINEPAYKPLIDKALWDRVEALRGARARTKGRGRGRPTRGPHLFVGGLLKCGLCGGSMVPRTSPREGYACYEALRTKGQGCAQGFVRRDWIDQQVGEYLLHAHTDIEGTIEEIARRVDLELAELDGLLEQAEHEVASTTAELKKIEADYVSGTLPAERYAALTARREDSLRAAEAESTRLRTRRDEVARSCADVNGEEEVLHFLAAVRNAIKGEAADASTVGALRALLVSIFDYFTYYGPDVAARRILTTDPAITQHAARCGWAWPTMREDVLERWHHNGSVPRLPLGCAGNKNKPVLTV